jgi:hypothetical protein
MGTLTYTQMDTEMLAALAGRGDISAERREVFLNLAQLRISRLRNWSELQTLTRGNLTYTGTALTDKFVAVPTRYKSTTSWVIADPSDLKDAKKLERLTPGQMDERVPVTDDLTTGHPSVYQVWADSFELWRVPDKAYTQIHKHTLWPADLDKDTPSVKSSLDNKDDMIITLAVSWAFLTLRQNEDAARWWNIYRNMAAAADIEEADKPDYVIKPASEVGLTTNNYWQDPFVRSITGV